MMIAIDTGGTKTLIAKFDSSATLVTKTKIPTPHDQSAYLSAIVHETNLLLQGEVPDAISIALPGVIRDGIAVVCKNLDWYDFDIISQLRPHWPDTPMYLENDANLGGVGAANLLPQVPEKLLYLTLSTGVGGGFVVNGDIDPALSESEFGDLGLEYNSQLTNWESIASGRAIYHIHPQPLGQDTEMSIKVEIAKRVSRGLMALLPVLRPSIVVVGGGFGAKYSYIKDLVARELSVLANEYQTQIITAPHPEEIVAYGCYYHAKHQLDR